MLQLTANEVESLPKDTKVYEGVGKVYALAVSRSKSSVRLTLAQVRLHSYTGRAEETRIRTGCTQSRDE